MKELACDDFALIETGVCLRAFLATPPEQNDAHGAHLSPNANSFRDFVIKC
jgi:hypothetical protein